MSIESDIQELLDAGIAREDIFVNDGNDQWGETCATTRQAAIELIEEWRRDAAAHGETIATSLNDLETLDNYEHRVRE